MVSNSRYKHGGKGKGVGGIGLGFKERPAIEGPGTSCIETNLSEQFKYDKKKGEGMAKPGVNRMAAVKQAYKHQFMSGFKPAGCLVACLFVCFVCLFVLFCFVLFVC